MNTLMKSLAGTALVLALSAPAFAKDKADPVAAAPAAASGSTIVKGIGMLNIEAAIANSDAYRTAQQQQQVTYKPQIDAARQRKAALDAQIKPLIDKLNADVAAKKPEALLQQQYVAIQQLQERGKQEIEQALAPLAQSDAYVKEQVAEQLDQAVQNAMGKQGVSLLLNPEAVIARANAYELTDDVIVELNALIPSTKMQLVPPAGWVPRQAREQQAAQQQGAAGQPAPRPAQQPAAPQTDGR
ncbi:MAG: hypothetical protein RLZZ84_977 [Pseudomonadota bacterium]|jgi:Skp family chaperone for outer membrane proteins